MSVVLRPTTMKIRNDGETEFHGFNVVADEKVAEKVSVIEAKEAEVLASIPDDYTEMSNSLGFFKKEVDWEVGHLNYENGKVATSAKRIRTVDYIPVLKDDTFIQITNKFPSYEIYVLIVYYDENKIFISSDTTYYSSPSANSLPSSGTYKSTAPQDGYAKICAYIRYEPTLTPEYTETLKSCFSICTLNVFEKHLQFEKSPIFNTLDIHLDGFKPVVGGAVSAYPTRVKFTKAKIPFDCILSFSDLEDTETFGSNYMITYTVHDTDGSTVVDQVSSWTLRSNVTPVKISKGQYLTVTTKYYPTEVNTSSPEAVDGIVNAVTFRLTKLANELKTLYNVVKPVTVLDVSGNYSSDYYSDYVDSVKSLSGVTLFAFQTDTHYGTRAGYNHAFKNIYDLVQLSKIMDLPLIANLGDVVDGNSSLSNQMSELVSVASVYSDAPSAYIQCIGNHDDNSWWASSHTHLYREILTPDIWNRLVSNAMSAKHNVVTLPSKRYGLYDDVNNKVRYIFLDTLDIDYTLVDGNGYAKYYGQWKKAVRQEQLNFLIDSLAYVGTAYKVIILSHHSFADGEDYANQAIINSDLVRGILEAFKNKSTFTGSGNTEDFEASVSVDFSSVNAGELIGCFAGHNHADAMYIINGITYVQTDNACVQTQDSSAGRSTSDTTINVIDIVNVNFSTKTVVLKRFGYGSDRSFTY